MAKQNVPGIAHLKYEYWTTDGNKMGKHNAMPEDELNGYWETMENGSPNAYDGEVQHYDHFQQHHKKKGAPTPTQILFAHIYVVYDYVNFYGYFKDYSQRDSEHTAPVLKNLHTVHKFLRTLTCTDEDIRQFTFESVNFDAADIEDLKKYVRSKSEPANLQELLQQFIIDNKNDCLNVYAAFAAVEAEWQNKPAEPKKKPAGKKETEKEDVKAKKRKPKDQSKKIKTEYELEEMAMDYREPCAIAKAAPADLSQQRIVALESDLSGALERERALREAFDTLQRNLQQQQKTAKETEAGLRSERDEVSKNARRLQKELKSAESERQKACEERDKALEKNRQLATTASKPDDVKRERDEAREHSRSLQAKLDKAESERDTAYTKRDEAFEENRKLKTKLRTTERERDEAGTKRDEVLEEISKLKTKLRTTERERDEAGTKRDEAIEESRKLTAQLKTTESERDIALRERDGALENEKRQQKALDDARASERNTRAMFNESDLRYSSKQAELEKAHQRNIELLKQLQDSEQDNIKKQRELDALTWRVAARNITPEPQGEFFARTREQINLDGERQQSDQDRLTAVASADTHDVVDFLKEDDEEAQPAQRTQNFSSPGGAPHLDSGAPCEAPPPSRKRTRTEAFPIGPAYSAFGFLAGPGAAADGPTSTFVADDSGVADDSDEPAAKFSRHY